MVDGFAWYVEQRHERLCRTAFLLTQDWAAAEDVVQTSLIKAWGVWQRIESNPDPYVYRIIVNTHASWWRRRWRGEVPTEAMPERPEQRDIAGTVADRAALWAATGALSPRQRSDLRAVFEEYSAEGPSGPAHLQEIIRRGRAARLRRRGLAGVALAGAAAAAVGVVAVFGPYGGGSAPGPASAVRVTYGVDLPGTVVGINGDTLALIHAESRSTVGEKVKVTFQPTTSSTGYAIRCADPKVWVLVRQGNATSFGRCGDRRGNSVDAQYDWQSAGPGWLRKPQTLEIWTFPSDAPVGQKFEDGSGTYDTDTIATTPERLARAVNQRPSEWIIGIYDKPAHPSPDPS